MRRVPRTFVLLPISSPAGRASVIWIAIPSSISEPKDEDNAGRHEKAANGTPSVQGVHRHVHQAEVVDGKRGEEIRRDNQPVDRSGPDLIDEGEAGEDRDRAGEPRQRRPPWHGADSIDGWQWTGQNGEETGEEERIEREENG